MIVRCEACGVERDRVSPGCAVHAQREAELVHLHSVATGFPCPAACPVCVARRTMERARRRGTR